MGSAECISQRKTLGVHNLAAPIDMLRWASSRQYVISAPCRPRGVNGYPTTQEMNTMTPPLMYAQRSFGRRHVSQGSPRKHMHFCLSLAHDCVLNVFIRKGAPLSYCATQLTVHLAGLLPKGLLLWAWQLMVCFCATYGRSMGIL